MTRGHLLVQMGRLDEASAMLEGRFESREVPVSTPMDASGVGAGRVALYTGDNATFARRPDRRGHVGRETPGFAVTPPGC